VNPSGAPTFAFDTPNLYVLLLVAGVCNGCVHDIMPFNHITSGRQLQVKKYEDAFLRGLQEDDDDRRASNCHCPVTAVINIVPPSSDKVEAFQIKLEEEGVDLRVEKSTRLRRPHATMKRKLLRLEANFTLHSRYL
jgi:hypothetical protein